MNVAITQQAMLINLYYVLYTMRDAEEYWNGGKNTEFSFPKILQTSGKDNGCFY